MKKTKQDTGKGRALFDKMINLFAEEKQQCFRCGSHVKGVHYAHCTEMSCPQ